MKRIAARSACSRFELHTPCPPGYIQWHTWAERKAKTHHQERCPACGLFEVWVPNSKPTPSDAKGLENAPEAQEGGTA